MRFEKTIQKLAAFIGLVRAYLGKIRATAHDCGCVRGEQKTSTGVVDLGEGPEDSIVWVYRCDSCGRLWLRVLFEAPHYTRAGHWYDALLDGNIDPQKIEIADIEEIFLKSSQKYRGGSLTDGKILPWDGVPTRII